MMNTPSFFTAKEIRSHSSNLYSREQLVYNYQITPTSNNILKIARQRHRPRAAIPNARAIHSDHAEPLMWKLVTVLHYTIAFMEVPSSLPL